MNKFTADVSSGSSSLLSLQANLLRSVCTREPDQCITTFTGSSNYSKCCIPELYERTVRRDDRLFKMSWWAPRAEKANLYSVFRNSTKFLSRLVLDGTLYEWEYYHSWCKQNVECENLMLLWVNLNELYFRVDVLGSTKMQSAFSGCYLEPGVWLSFVLLSKSSKM